MFGAIGSNLKLPVVVWFVVVDDLQEQGLILGEIVGESPLHCLLLPTQFHPRVLLIITLVQFIYHKIPM